MGRSEFERAAREQNEERARKVLEARENGSPCVIIDMLAFGGVPYCSTHRVMGDCPYGGAR